MLLMLFINDNNSADDGVAAPGDVDKRDDSPARRLSGLVRTFVGDAEALLMNKGEGDNCLI
jgi:hypothetical protein